MTSAEDHGVGNQTVFQYGSNPFPVLTRVGSSGANISAIDDTRLKAGNAQVVMVTKVVVQVLLTFHQRVQLKNHKWLQFQMIK